MSVETVELDRFLTDLGQRQQQLLAMAAGGSSQALLEGIGDLGERLLVVDEELRVQQEELADARQRLAARSGDQTFLDTLIPMVRTDDGGRVLEVNAAAGRLAARWYVDPGYRPIASWFVLPDRRVVRDLITAVRRGQPAPERRLRLLAPGNETALEVEVRVVEETTGALRRTLRWQLDGARAVAPSAGSVVDLVAEDLASFAIGLGDVPSDEVLRTAVHEQVGLVPGARAATLGVVGSGRVELVEGSTAAAAAYEAEILLGGGGPGSEALRAPGTVVVASDLGDAGRWSQLARRSDAEPDSAVSVAVALPHNHRHLVLTWFADGTGVFGSDEATPDVARLVLLAAAHACVAVDRALEEVNLRRAIESRQLIGQAVAVVALRAGVDRSEAFRQLALRSQLTNRKLHAVAQGVVAEVWPRD